LFVRLLRGATDGTGPLFDVPFSEGQEATELLVLVRAPGFDVNPDYRVLRVPRDAGSDTVEFRLRARSGGEQVMDVKFILGADPIGHCCVVTHVSESLAVGNAETILLDPVVGELMEFKGEAHALLVVTETNGRLKWDIAKRDAKLRSIGCSPGMFDSKEKSGWSVKRAPLIKEIPGARPLGGRSLTSLRAIGHQLYSQIAPPTLVDELGTLQDDALVIVDGNIDWIPWELLAEQPSGRLWGDRFAMRRQREEIQLDPSDDILFSQSVTQ
jgi:hypothetical protein